VFYGAHNSGGEVITNSYYPFTRKLGAYYPGMESAQ
jgi:hypothetical protein